MKKERKGRGKGDGGRGGREGGGRGSTIPIPGGKQKKKKTYGKILYMERKNGKRNRKTKITRNIHQKKKKKKTVPPSDDQTYILPGWEKNS